MAAASVALIGYRGTGKSTVGRLLAERLGQRFVDTDLLIESRCHESIASIFHRGGEKLFRDFESEALESLTESAEPLVIAGGGGIVLREANRTVLRRLAPGKIFLLTASAEAVARRIRSDARSGQTRPPLTDLSFQDEINAVLRERNPIYRALADHSVETEGKTPGEIAGEILLLL